MNDLFSVVVPILNEREHVLPLLESIHNQTYRPIEVIVVDGGSTDGTAPLIRQFIEQMNRTAFIVRVTEGKGNVAAARNLGIQISSGGNVLLLDADLLISDPNILQQLDDALEDRDMAHFKTRTIPDSWLEYHLMLDSEAPLFTSNNVAGWAFKREILNRIRFDDSLGFGEDMDFMYRLSTSGLLRPTQIEGVGLRHFPHTLRELMRQKLWYGRTVIKWVGKHHSPRELLVLSPLAAFGLLILLLPAFYLSVTFGVVLSAIFLSIPLALFFTSRRKSMRHLAYLIFVRTVYGSFFFTIGFMQGVKQLLLHGSVNAARDWSSS